MKKIINVIVIGIFLLIGICFAFRLIESPNDDIKDDDFSILPVASVQVGQELPYEIKSFNDEILIDVGNDWDSVDVLNPSVVEFNGEFYNYYSGWDGQVWRTGLATSSDGISWKKEVGSVLDIRPDAWDNVYIAANGSAINFNEKVYYFYQGLSSDVGCAEVGLAISSDGKSFDIRTKESVLKVGSAGEWDYNGVADPYVISFGGNLYMYYLGMDELNVQRLGVAMSKDGQNWIKSENNPIMDVGVMGSFDENGLGEPSVIYKAPYFYMLYTGRNAIEQRNIGVAISSDGVNWKKLSYDGMFNLFDNSWDNQVICDTTILENENGNYTVWYGGGNVAAPAENLNGKIGSFEINFSGVRDATNFNANTWDDKVVLSTDFINGSYHIEGEDGGKSIWMSDNTSVLYR